MAKRVGIAGFVFLAVIILISVDYTMGSSEERYKEEYKAAVKECLENEQAVCEKAEEIARDAGLSDSTREKWESELDEESKPESEPEPDYVAGMETKQHLNQGLNFMTQAKANMKNKEVFDESIKNAIMEFSLAIGTSSGETQRAKAYEYRGTAYMIQKKYNKALEDIKKAAQIQPDSPSVYYNLTCLYSLTKDIDLSLDALDKALENGFSDYDTLRGDPDISNVRKSPEFREILEKHKVFIGK